MFNAPNIKGPRFRKEHKTLMNGELLAKFLKIHPQHAGLALKDFEKIVRTGSKKMWKTTIEERDGISLPIGGTIFIGTTTIKVKNNYNIQASIAANTPVKHRNYDTDGHVAKIYYSPYLSKISGRDRSIWSFKGHRDYKRTIAKEYPKNWKKYIVAADIYNLLKTYKRHKTRQYMQKANTKITEVYNEFDLT